jgi:hypothetical protein
MRRFLTTVMSLTLLLGAVQIASPTPAKGVTASTSYEGHYGKWERRQCRLGRSNGWSNLEIRDLIRCAQRRIGNLYSPNQPGAALAIAKRESGFQEGASNPSSSAGGLFQWLSSSWPWSQFPVLARHYHLPNNRFDPRSAAFISSMYMKRYGCQPWVYSGTVLC